MPISNWDFTFLTIHKKISDPKFLWLIKQFSAGYDY